MADTEQAGHSEPVTGEKRAASPTPQANDPSTKRSKTEEEGKQGGGRGGGNQSAKRGRRGSSRRGGPQANKSRRDAVTERARERNGEAGTQGDESKSREPRLPKRKVALLMGYQGTGMNGSQM